MNKAMNQTTVMVFYPDVETADKAVVALLREDIPRESISVARLPESVSDHSATPGDAKLVEGAAGFGAVTGGLTGAAMALVTVAVPGIGPIAAAGPLAALLSGVTGAAIGAGAGAVTATIAGVLLDMGMDEEMATEAVSKLHGGEVVVAVSGTDGLLPKALDIMKRFNNRGTGHSKTPQRSDN
jgi:hypothetical protein